MKDRLAYLFARFLEQQCSDAERKELMSLALEEELQDDLKLLLSDAWEYTGETEDISEEKVTGLMDRLFPASGNAPVRRLSWRKWAVAASLLFLVGLGIWYLSQPKANDPGNINVAKKEDVPAPDKNRAMIMLADGKVVYLDSVVNGELAMVNGVKLVKMADGEIVYSRESGVDSRESVHRQAQGGKVFYNTLSNPRGSRVIDMTLSDGSRIWLNAGSSVTYPVAFAGNERKVSITGEAYFEVNGQRSMVNGERMPFIVSKGDMEVKVLGTKFNVNAYDDERDIRVTLLEGSVGVSTVHRPQLKVIKPGEQAIVNAKYEVKSTNADVEAVMAWKNGLFNFNNSDLSMVLKQLARWYDLEVIYPGIIPKRTFGGEMQRDLNLSEVLKLLEKNQVRFRLEGKKLIVSI